MITHCRVNEPEMKKVKPRVPVVRVNKRRSITRYIHLAILGIDRLIAEMSHSTANGIVQRTLDP